MSFNHRKYHFDRLTIPKTAIAGQTEGWTAIEDPAIEMHANVCSHVFRTNTQDPLLQKKKGGVHK